MKNLIPFNCDSENPNNYCEDCHDTGYIGDNGPGGYPGNREYMP